MMPKRFWDLLDGNDDLRPSEYLLAIVGVCCVFVAVLVGALV